MKTFSTSGTGSQQSLSEIENNKIPVYDTKTDAESDLANLTVGQIIATKDEGNENSTPVDVVQDGNMHAVTSNAVADSLSYSTSETLTGGKWVDGKPIYRKVIQKNIAITNNTDINFSSDLPDADTIVSFSQIIIDGSSTKWWYNTYNFAYQLYTLTSGEIHEIFSSNQGWHVDQAIQSFIFEYTKTTD